MNERQNKIIELLSEHKKMEVVKLSEMMGVSQVTIRKDLASLEDTGLIIREHGYATIHDSDDINHRLVYKYEKKLNIAKKASELVSDGETILIESGSCCALLALEVSKEKHHVTIITNSSFIATFIRKNTDCKVILLGGQYQNEAQVNVGPLIKKCVENFYVDKFFIGTDGFTIQSGFTGNDFMRAEAVRDMAMQANKIMVVTDSSKFNRMGTISLLPTSKVHTVITDNEISEEICEYLTSQNVHILKA